MRKLIGVLGVLLVAMLPVVAVAQATPPATQADSVTEVRLRDGSVVVGRLEVESETLVVIVTAAGTRVEIPRAQIAGMRRVVPRAGGEVWPDDNNVTRLFFTSTGRPLPKGEGYVSSYWLFFPFVGYGITDRITLAGGTPIIPGGIGKVFYLAPKIALYDSERLSFSAGTLSMFSTDYFNEGSLGIVYGVGTYGSRDNALSFGAGWFYADVEDEIATSNEPVFMLGGERRISRRVKLITENWFAVNPGVTGLMSGGVRFIGDRLSADFALGGLTGTEGACCLPMLNFVWSFGGGR
ncbi:MAG TPA: hypothetical protein PK788_07005 [Gemmatimonadaceae bacterium]|nr:hypothetical protein [Gemmatimonadaceae bacterium]HRQ77878.1 hypothetical protein [Gemmatimonadaceae bacterium]